MLQCTLVLALLNVTGPGIAWADDLDTSYQALQAAMAEKDPTVIKKLAAQTVGVARQAAAEPAPSAADEQDAWKKRVAYAHEVETYTEYALYATAVQAQPAVTADLLGTLESQNPKSKYLDQCYGVYLYALAKTGSEAKAQTVAEKALANFPQNPDLLLIAANTALSRKQNDRALEYANRLVTALNKRAKPEGVAQADWERQRNASLGRGFWIAGLMSAEKTRYADVDKDFRAALPLIKTDEGMTGAALFHLGVANYQIGKMTLNKAKMLEGVKFSEDAARINGPFAHQAFLNSQIMKTEAAKMR